MTYCDSCHDKEAAENYTLKAKIEGDGRGEPVIALEVLVNVHLCSDCAEQYEPYLDDERTASVTLTECGGGYRD